MAAVRVTTEMLKAFTGDGDVVAWLQKVKLVARLQGVKDLATFLPLYLEGDALALFLQLSEQEQADAGVVERKLLSAFTDSPFVAYAKLAQRRWNGEQVDVFANELRRLGGLSGLSGDGLDRVTKFAFVNGFPDNISCELQQVNDIFSMPMSEVLSRARVLVTTRKENFTASVAQCSCVDIRVPKTEGREGGVVGGFRGSCYRCGGPHMARHCRSRQPRDIVCFRCNTPGHIASQCNLNQGNEQGVAGAPAASLHK